jgi:Trk K+ transport system NAD-binding subunit
LARRDAVTVTVDAIAAADRLDVVDIGNGFVILEYEAPSHWTGKTLVDLDLRKKCEAQVLMIKRGSEQHFPGPHTRIHTGDVLLVTGPGRRLVKDLRRL